MNKNILIYILLFIVFILSYKYYKLYNYTLKLDNNTNKDDFNTVIFPFNYLFNKNKISNYKDKKKIIDKDEIKTNLNVEKDKRNNCYLIDSDDDDIYIYKNYNENTYDDLFNNNFTILINKDDNNINNINNLTFNKDDNNINILTFEKNDNSLIFKKDTDDINSLTFEKNDNSLIFKKDDNENENEKINNIKINIQYLEKQIKPLKNIKFKNLN